MRELMAKVCDKKQKEIAADIKNVFRIVGQPEERKECLQRAEEMVAKWEECYPKVATMLREGLEDCLTVCERPSAHRRKLHSGEYVGTNDAGIETAQQQLSVFFLNRESCDRLIAAHLVEMDEQWQMKANAM